jgi:hypothetical protein
LFEPVGGMVRPLVAEEEHAQGCLRGWQRAGQTEEQSGDAEEGGAPLEQGWGPARVRGPAKQG